MVQVHPGPHTSKIRGYSHFSPCEEYLSKDQLANYLPTLRLAGWHHTQSVKTIRVKAERLASITNACLSRRMSRVRVPSFTPLLKTFPFSRGLETRRMVVSAELQHEIFLLTVTK